ncbi:MAG: hypothetical protein Q8O14_09905 [bacterium]|jgi:hypothetical protein|nr:hypothetical protein [bacterium]
MGLGRLLPLALTILLLSCEDEALSPPAPAIQGRVLTADGAGAAGLGILVSLELPYPSEAGDTLIANAAGGSSSPIRFHLPAAGHAIITVHEAESGVVLDTLLDTLRPAGLNTIQWDLRDRAGELLPADVYLLSLVALGQRFGYLSLVNPDPHEAGAPWRVQAVTAADGSFQIAESQLPFRHDLTFTLVNPAGLTLGSWELERRVRVHVAGTDGWLAASGPLGLDTLAAGGLRIHLPE